LLTKTAGLLVGFATVIVADWSTAVVAQSVPVPAPVVPDREIQPPSTRPLPNPTPVTPLPPPDELLPPSPTPPTTSPPAVDPGDVPDTITVERFEVTGSTVFKPEQFAELLKSYTGRPITLAELFQARAAVTDFYVGKGYITSGAYIPPQKLEGGVVEIRVVEGGLEDIKVTGTNRLKPSYVRRRLEIATQPPLNRDRLLEALQLLQLNPLIQNLAAELSAGSRPGTSLLEVKVTEADVVDLQITLDNGRSPNVGTDRRQIQFNHGNLLGLGDALSLSYTNTDGSNAFDFSYTVPTNPRNGSVSLAIGTATSRVIRPEPFDQLRIRSESTYYELTLRQPLMQTPTQEFAIGVTATHRDSTATFNPFGISGDIPFPTSGSDNDGKTSITALRFFQEWVKRTSQSVFAVRSQFSVGLDALDSTINAAPPDSRFVAWRGQVQWVRLLAPETLLLLRGDLQFADRPIPGVEQFGLGGIQSVRGYRQDALLTDNGIFASAEVRVPIVRFPRASGILHLTPFLEFGTGWNRSGGQADPDPSTLLSVGLGLRLQLNDNLTARLDWGIPLISVDGNKDTWQENGVYFSIVYRFF
jgi:hemolysin activation/secretion protein